MPTDKYKNIKYPFIPSDRRFHYVPPDNEFMLEARTMARKSTDKMMPVGAVIVKNGFIIGRGVNASEYHKKFGCERQKKKMPTGIGYGLCPGCDPKFHAEQTAIRDAEIKGKDTKGADLYLWGHWWNCQKCWEKMKLAGIKNVYLMENSEKLFNREVPCNLVGHQFDQF